MGVGEFNGEWQPCDGLASHPLEGINTRSHLMLSNQDNLRPDGVLRLVCTLNLTSIISFFFFVYSFVFIGDQSVQDNGASFSGWAESNYSLGEADEQVLSLLLAESTFDPLLDNIDWGDDSYTGDINLNPD